jgi:hypothetical protein
MNYLKSNMEAIVLQRGSLLKVADIERAVYLTHEDDI